MTKYLLDTNIVSAIMEKHPGVLRKRESTGSDDRLVVCTIVAGELMYGVLRRPDGKRKRELEDRLRAVLDSLERVAVPDAAAEEYGRIKAEARHSGVALGDNDMWIAACARVIGAVVVTADADFGRIPGLTVENWR